MPSTRPAWLAITPSERLFTTSPPEKPLVPRPGITEKPKGLRTSWLEGACWETSADTTCAGGTGSSAPAENDTTAARTPAHTETLDFIANPFPSRAIGDWNTRAPPICHLPRSRFFPGTPGRAEPVRSRAC
jgi:hypothetical protein